MWILPTNASYAFHSMFESHGELRAYANLFILGREHEEELKEPSNPAHEIREMWSAGSGVAARLGIVYLVAIMEAYATDVVLEVLDRRIRVVNQEMLNQPAPTSEDEDIWNEIQLEQAEVNRNNPFYLFAEIAKQHIQKRGRQAILKSMVEILEKHFGVNIENRDSHFTNWDKLQTLRKRIVHHRASSRKKTNPITIKDQTETLDEIIVEKDTVLRNIDLMYNFAVAVEEAINSIQLRRDWKDCD